MAIRFTNWISKSLDENLKPQKTTKVNYLIFVFFMLNCKSMKFAYKSYMKINNFTVPGIFINFLYTLTHWYHLRSHVCTVNCISVSFNIDI